MKEGLSIITLVNDRAAYGACRASFDHPADWIAIDADAHGWNAGQGLNAGLARATGGWVMCVHQDVRFPVDWWSQARVQIAQWRTRHSRWPAVVGLVGATMHGQYRGAVLDPHGWRRWRGLPARVACLDEHVLVVRHDSGLSFDASIPGFHGYGADIALTARSRGLDAIAIDAPVVHLSPGRIDDAWHVAADHLARKWARTTGGVIPGCARTIANPGVRTLPRRILVSAIKRLSEHRAQRGHSPAALRSVLDSPNEAWARTTTTPSARRQEAA